MSDPLLTFLKYVFLAILYLFFLRVLRAVWIELREPKPAPVPAGPPPPPAAPSPGRSRRRSPRQPARLVVVEPAVRRGQEFPLADELTVGRAGGCGIPLPDDTFVSQLHARVFRHDSQLFIEDLGSTNGTFLNKKKIASAVVMHTGDKLKVGQTTLEVQK